MSGILISLFDKQRFEYSYLSSTTSQTITFARALDVTPYMSVTVMARIHRITMSAGQSFTFTLQNTLPSFEDPQEFTDTTTTFLTLSVPSSTAAPALLSNNGVVPQAFLKVILTATQGGTTGATLYAEMSACLLLRDQR